VVIKIFEKDMHISLLTDIYGELLSERKRELLEYYYNEDYSLAEISEITGISRQGIRDSVKKSEAELREFESKLCLAAHAQELSLKIDALKNILLGIIEKENDPEQREALMKAVSLVDTLGL